MKNKKRIQVESSKGRKIINPPSQHDMKCSTQLNLSNYPRRNN